MYQYTDFDRHFIRNRAAQYRDQLERNLRGELTFNRIQFQHGMSIAEFICSFGTEAQCAEAVKLARWPKGFRCPRCGSAQTERLAAFGSTACKALYRCITCREPFEHFKPI